MRFRNALLLSSLLALAGCSGGKTVSFEQLHVGFNAPESISDTRGFDEFYLTEDAARTSWIRSALAPQQFDGVLRRVDFRTEVLMVTSPGRRKNLTGAITLKKVTVEGGSVEPFLLIGVNEENCPQPMKDSFPFVVFVIERPNSNNLALGHFNRNYGDGCKTVVSGTPVSRHP